MSNLDKRVLKKKFVGCLIGSLIGDCLGAPFEGDTMSTYNQRQIQKYFDKLEDPNFNGPICCYTDDSAMMKTLAKCLTEKPEIDYYHIAKEFVQEYFTDPNRGYGQNVIQVFKTLRLSKFVDIYKPAADQFNGSGSYGNGGAMRIAPIALFFYDNYDLMLEAARKTTELTHTNNLGIHGAILQCIAIHQALLYNSSNLLNPEKFCEDLSKKIRQVEERDDDGSNLSDCFPYEDKLNLVKHFLNMKYHDELNNEVIQNLGNSISAYESVPTAIYCFLRAVKSEIPNVTTNNIFRRTIQYAISLGGDTDTIACMSGAIAGAYLGEDIINSQMAQHCEFLAEVKSLACDLYNCVIE